MDSGNQLKQAGESYYKGLHESASLQRARKPYQMRNALTGFAIIAFMGGVYLYSISAVKQDDFSDVVDLIPLPEELKNIVTIEDELRDKELAAKELGGSAVSALSMAANQTVSGAQEVQQPRSGVLGLLPRRLSDMDWVKRRGWVEEGKGNVLVWGAPNVDKIGSMKENWGVSGRRVV